MKKIKKYAPTIVFLLFIFSMGIAFLVLPKKAYSTSEKRYLASFPKLTSESFLSGQFGTDFEKYLSDHMTGRNFFVGLNAYASLVQGLNGVSGKYLCSDGYIINEPLDQYDNRLDENTEIIKTFADSVDVPVTMTLVPSTGYIMEDKLPSNHLPYKDDQYFAQMESAFKDSGVSFVNLLEPFQTYTANGDQLYYKTDHHWTSLGAYRAYQLICQSMGLEATPEDQFNIESYPDFYGTTYSGSAYWFTAPDNIELWQNKNHTEGSITVEITEGQTTTESDSLFYKEHLSEDDKYPVYLDGNQPFVRITNTNAPKGKLIVIKDSFAHCLVPFLADNYSEIVMVDLRYYKASVSDLIKTENADQVLIAYGIDNLATDTDLLWLK